MCAGWSPEQQRLTGVERPVQVCPFSAHELAARDDDGGARTPQERGEILRCPFFGTLRRTPATRTTTFPGDATASVSGRVAASESFRLSALEGAAVESCARTGAPRTSMNEAPRVALTDTPFATTAAVVPPRR